MRLDGNITMQEWILHALAHQRLTAEQISWIANVHVSTVRKHLNRLHVEGLVIRFRSHDGTGDQWRVVRS